MRRKLRLSIIQFTLLTISCAIVSAQPVRQSESRPALSATTLLTIIRHEDERRWDKQLENFLKDADPKVRARAALAAGRIGDDGAVPALADMLLVDHDNGVRDMAAFALGEIEASGGAYALVTVLQNPDKPARARAIEALGKITAAIMAGPPAQRATVIDDARIDQCKTAIVGALRFEAKRKPRGDRETILLGLTAVLRTKPDGVGDVVAAFRDDPDPAIVATALNTMARLRLKDANERVRQLLNHFDPIVRANAARVIGAAEHKEAFDAVLDHALHDIDLRVRVSAIRALASLKDARASEPLLHRGIMLSTDARSTSEILESATAIGILLRNSKSDEAITWLRQMRAGVNAKAPEIEVAMARINPELYLTEEMKFGVGSPATIAAGLTEIATVKKTDAALQTEAAVAWLHDLLSCQPGGRHKCLLQPLTLSPILEAYAAFKPAELNSLAKQHLNDQDVIVRATAAEIIGGLPPNDENTRVLIDALLRALRDKESNDAALAILNALAKQKNAAANDAIKTALDAKDHLIRRRAVALLKANGAGDFSDRIGTVQTRNTIVDYRRAMARIGKHPTATVVTNRGSFTIEFLPDEAPLTVDNFLQLAKRSYFNGQTIPRVVPNFVVQAGDPRGDQNGGPGYTIRCEINEVPFERAAVGMALSGKDTGGSQWFVTHSPQPHLDGGYTVFGRVIRGMDVIDNLARGDVIRRVVVRER
ncbi:MAG TPA: peptidylprolyl isomerase [Pyrinomonadaceae bacterium]|nr:peptidylprolyl isomerase [Pyrinomonadaceae bacterium]